MDDEVTTCLIDSLSALKEGKAVDSLAAANRALSILQKDDACSQPLLIRAYHRKAAALSALGDPVQAVRVYRDGVRASQGDEQLAAGLRLALDALPPTWHAAYWAQRVSAGESAARFSSRDGRLLRSVPATERLGSLQLRSQLESVFETHGYVLEEVSDLAADVWKAGRRDPGRAALAYARAWAYLEAGNHEQAARDARYAIVYGPREETKNGNETATNPHNASDGEEDGSDWMEGSPWLQAAMQSLWPAALVLLSAAYEARADNVRAILLAALAVEKCAEDDTLHAECAEQAVERLATRVPPECAEAVRSGGSTALLFLLSKANLASKPEIMRQRPKYYYYYEWMKKRINDQYPALPEPVMDKLLTIDANELDLVLQYPAATRQMVGNLLEVLEQNGTEHLETYRVPLLSWDDVKTLQGPDTVGLPLGSTAPTTQEESTKRLVEASSSSLYGAGSTSHLLEPNMESAFQEHNNNDHHHVEKQSIDFHDRPAVQIVEVEETSGLLEDLD